MTRSDGAIRVIAPPGRPPTWSGPLRAVDALTWRADDGADPGSALTAFLDEHGVTGRRDRGRAVVLLAGADGCAALGGTATGAPSPVPAVPDLVAVAVEPGDPQRTAPPSSSVPASAWATTWSDDEHAAAVERVRDAIARGELYQANVVGHRAAAHRGDPVALAARAAALAGADYGGVLAGEGWAVGSASPEQLVRVTGRRVTTVPVKGTGTREALQRSEKDRAEHVMIVDLERNDLSRVAVTGSVAVERLYDLAPWAGLWHAGSVVAAELEDGVGPVDVLRAVAPGGSVTGAPKRAACALLAQLEPVGRGPAMGAFGLLWRGGMDLGLTIRTVAADDDRVHLWAGGGVTWGSSAADEVAEAHAKAAPVVAALAGADPVRSGRRPPGRG